VNARRSGQEEAWRTTVSAPALALDHGRRIAQRAADRMHVDPHQRRVVDAAGAKHFLEQGFLFDPLPVSGNQIGQQLKGRSAQRHGLGIDRYPAGASVELYTWSGFDWLRAAENSLQNEGKLDLEQVLGHPGIGKGV